MMGIGIPARIASQADIDFGGCGTGKLPSKCEMASESWNTKSFFGYISKLFKALDLTLKLASQLEKLPKRDIKWYRQGLNLFDKIVGSWSANY